MIIALGIDLVELDRFRDSLDRGGDPLRRRLFTPAELDLAAPLGRSLEFLAGRFAAKEAVFKCLGTGWGEGVGWHQVEVLRGDLGAPTLELSGKAREKARARGIGAWHLSITHTGRTAAAVAVAASL